MISEDIFNAKKDDYENTPLFLGSKPGLLDTINKQYPELWRLYFLMKSLDWDHNEFDYKSCIAEFQTCSKTEYEIMIKTLAWQWEADSIAANSIAPIVAPFVSSTELWALWSAISVNEILHGLTYSEIVAGSFNDGKAAMASVLGEVEALQRMKTVAHAMTNVKKMSANLTLGNIARDSNEARDAIMLFTVALLALERIQFMSSFAITFAFAEAGMFLPIGKAVQKICNDEYNVHVPTGKEILRIERSTKIGSASFERIKPLATALIDEVVTSELKWTENHLFQGDRQLVGCTCEDIKNWVLFGANDVYNTLGIKNNFKIVGKNPLGYITEWISINSQQVSPQEEKTGNYLLGGFKNNTDGKKYDLDF